MEGDIMKKIVILLLLVLGTAYADYNPQGGCGYDANGVYWCW